MAETGSMKYFTIRDLENSLGRKKFPCLEVSTRKFRI